MAKNNSLYNYILNLGLHRCASAFDVFHTKNANWAILISSSFVLFCFWLKFIFSIEILSIQTCSIILVSNLVSVYYNIKNNDEYFKFSLVIGYSIAILIQTLVLEGNGGYHFYFLNVAVFSILLFPIQQRNNILIAFLLPILFFYTVEVLLLNTVIKESITVLNLVVFTILLLVAFILILNHIYTLVSILENEIQKHLDVKPVFDYSTLSQLNNKFLGKIGYESFNDVFLWEFDIDNSIFRVNDRFLTMLGFPATSQNISFEQFLNFVDDDFQGLFEQNFNSIKQNNDKVFVFQFLMNLANPVGSFWFEMSCKGQHDQISDKYIVVGVFKNINNHKNAESSLYDAYTELDNLLNYSSSGIIIQNDKKIEYVNSQFLKMVNLNKDEFLRLEVPYELQKKEHSSISGLTKVDDGHEFSLICYDGSVLDVLAIRKTIKYRGGHSTLLLLNDFTSIKKYQNELELKESQARYNENIAQKQNKLLESIINSLPLMLQVFDEKGKLYRNSTYMQDHFGWDENDLCDIDALYKTVTDPIDYSSMIKSLSTTKNEWIAYKMTDKGGNLHSSEWTSFKIDNLFTIRLGLDVTERNKIKGDYENAIDQLQQLNHRLKQREEKLDRNREKLSQANIQLYEKNIILEESQNKYKLLSEAAYEAILMLEKGLVFDSNKAAGDLLGFEEDILKGIHISDLVVPSQRSLFLKMLNENQPFSNLEITFVKNNGHLFYAEVQAKPFVFNHKSIFLLAVRDITYRKRLENEARESEKNIRNLIDNINIGVFLKMSTGELFYNKTFLSILCLDQLPEGFMICNFIENKDKERVSEVIDEVERTILNSWSGDIVLDLPHQKDVNMTIVSTTFKLKSAMLISIVDITQRKQAEKELNLSFAYQKALLNSGDISYWAADRNFKLLFANKFHDVMSKKYLGVKLQEGDDVRNVFEDIMFKDNLDLEYQKVIKGENVVKNMKLTLPGHNTVVWLELNLSPIYLDGIISGVLARTRDVTESIKNIELIKRNEERLREAQLLAKVGSWEEDIQSKEYYWSEGILNIFNLQNEQKGGVDKIVEWLGSQNQEKFFSQYNLTLNGEMPIQTQYEVAINGDVKWLNITLLKNFDDQSSNYIIKGTIQDITDSKLNELKIIENEQLLNTIIDNLPVIFHLFNAQGLSLRVNQELNKFFNVKKGATPVGLYNITKDIKMFGYDNIELVKKAFNGEGVVIEGTEVNLENVKGRNGLDKPSGIKYLDSLFTPIFDHSGKLTSVVYLGIDTTDNVIKSKKLIERHTDLIEATRQASEYKLVALRSAMNPHFIFNVLNSIQYFISKNDKEQALTHLSMFSKLVRKILESSMNSKIPLTEEVTLLKYYIDLENLRFDNKFEIVYEMDDELFEEDILIPSLVIQPYVENAIVHGLLNKKTGKGILGISMREQNDFLICTIEDNGVGREAASKLRDMDHKSLGTKVTEERLKIINKFDEVSVKYIDLYDKAGKPAGTKTELKIKIN